MASKIDLEVYNKIQGLLPSASIATLRKIDKLFKSLEVSKGIPFSQTGYTHPDFVKPKKEEPKTIFIDQKLADELKKTKITVVRKSKPRTDSVLNTDNAEDKPSQISKSNNLTKEFKSKIFNSDDEKLTELQKIGSKFVESINVDDILSRSLEYKKIVTEDVQKKYLKIAKDLKTAELTLKATKDIIDSDYKKPMLDAEELGDFKKYSELHARYIASLKFLDKTKKDYNDLLKKKQQIIDDGNDKMTEFFISEMTKKVSEVREINHKSDAELFGQLRQPKSKIAQSLVNGMKALPQDWIEQMEERGQLEIRKSNRGHFAKNVLLWDKKTKTYVTDENGNVARTDEIQISGDSLGKQTATAIHELGHRLTQANSNVYFMEKAFFERRTKNCEVERLKDVIKDSGYEPKEVTKKDNFVHAYMGKFYERKDGMDFEIISMGLEYFYTKPYELKKDMDMFNFIAGVIAIL